MESLIRMSNIIKVFPPQLVALDNISVEFQKGEIHAIVGENGAGKSTLMKILYGLESRNSGEITFRSQLTNFNTPGEAILAGIGMVHQEILLVQEYTIWENIVLGVEPANMIGRINKETAIRSVKLKIDEFNFYLNPEDKIENLSVAARQKVEILKLLYRNVEVLILDEPTAVLTPQEIPQLFNELKRLRSIGKTILFISHHLDEVLALSDRITVMRKGQLIGTVKAADTNKEDLAKMMVGRNVLFLSQRAAKPAGPVVFQTKDLSLRDPNGKIRLDNINITVHSGEIVGIAGVEGNGQFELVNTIMGLTSPSQGQIIAGSVDLTHADILERRKLISFVSQDRGKMGAASRASIKENLMMTHHRLNASFTSWKGLILNDTFARSFTTLIKNEFNISMGSINNPFKSLSGGNQQKVILGRELSLDTPFLLLDQPTRGLDVGSIEYVHDTILKMRNKDRAILMISADLEELFRIADRILVLHKGKISADTPVEETNIEIVGYQMLQGKEI